MNTVIEIEREQKWDLGCHADILDVLKYNCAKRRWPLDHIGIKQVYLPDGSRLRVYSDGAAYVERKTRLGAGVNREERAEISLAQFFHMLNLAQDEVGEDEDLPTIVKDRYTFFDDENRKWELDYFREFGYYLLEHEYDEAPETDIPSFLQSFLLKEVTDDERYTNARLARAEERWPSN